MKNLIEQSRQRYMDRMARYFDECDIVNDIVAQMVNLPDFWELSLVYEKFGNHRIVFVHHGFREKEYEEDPLGSYLEIVRQVERTFRIILQKRMTQHEYLIAEGKFSTKIMGDTYNFNVEVRQFQIDKCEIEYTDEIVKVPRPAGFCKQLLFN